MMNYRCVKCGFMLLTDTSDSGTMKVSNHYCHIKCRDIMWPGIYTIPDYPAKPQATW